MRNRLAVRGTPSSVTWCTCDTDREWVNTWIRTPFEPGGEAGCKHDRRKNVQGGMRVLTALLAGCGLLAFAAYAPAQSSGKKKTNVQVHSKASVKAKTRIKTWRNDPWWATEHALMNRDQRLTP